ncbi:hypothetical protein L9F63_005324 [Diploptera punctata]|uniref:Uncharacterized protein n=1 Tax=Diploptera punctata TaxID=6984 RepID=A0AAD7ZDB8_DIPPU|nr:hypothetical protein L9F63_005324 [Diploptera punctata]
MGDLKVNAGNEKEKAGFKPGHKRSGSDVIDCQGEDCNFQNGRNTNLQNHVESLNPTNELHPSRRRSSDIVDCDNIGDGISLTEVDGLPPRPTNLGTLSDQKQRTEEWRMYKSSSKDLLDATPMTPPEETQMNNTDLRAYATEALMPVEFNEDEYNMQHQHRGHAVILNHDKFDDKDHGPREGSVHDVNSLKATFSSLGFTVTVHNNPDYCKIRCIISKLAKEDHSNNDCLVVIVLTHGEADGRLVPRDGNVSYKVETLWEPFTSDKCPTLAGKPKLFFIQACRGKQVDPGTVLKRKLRNRDEYDSCPASYSIPTHADFLIAYSTMEGFYSFRNLDTGTWFIQSLCKELNPHDNLLQILTKTTRRVAQLESESDNIEIDKRKQVPSTISMLTRNLYFHPKH